MYRLLEKEKKLFRCLVPSISSLPSKEAVDSLVRNGGEVSTRGGQGLAPAGVTSVHNIYTGNINTTGDLFLASVQEIPPCVKNL